MAAKDCLSGHQAQQCGHDIAQAAGNIADSATQISNAVSDCSSVGNDCATALATVFSDLNAMASTMDQAVDDCADLSNPIPCIEDVGSITSSLVSVTRDIKAAAKTCKKSPPSLPTVALAESLVSTFAAQSNGENGNTLDLTWEDCGAPDAGVKVTDVQPSKVILGATTVISGSGMLKADRTGGSFTMDMVGLGGAKLLNNCKGDAAKDTTCSIGLGPVKVGSTTFHGFDFPMMAGDVTGVPKVDLELPAGLPSFATSTTCTLKTFGPKGEPDICVIIKTVPSLEAPAITASDYVNLDKLTNKDAKITVTDKCAANGEKCMVNVEKVDCPTDEPQPLNFKFSGQGKALEAIDTADMHVVARFAGVKLLDKSLSACGEQTIELPAGAGSITLDLLDCPVADQAEFSILGSVAATQKLPFGKLDIEISAADSSSNKLLDLEVLVQA